MKAPQPITPAFAPCPFPAPSPTWTAVPADKTCAVQMWPCACSFDRRRKAAGIGIGLPEDFDERHRLVFRLIGMCMNQWQGCPERSCRRHCGCMAPSGVCINVRKDEPDANEVKFDIASRHAYLTLRAEKRAHPRLFPA